MFFILLFDYRAFKWALQREGQGGFAFRLWAFECKKLNADVACTTTYGTRRWFTERRTGSVDISGMSLAQSAFTEFTEEIGSHDVTAVRTTLWWALRSEFGPAGSALVELHEKDSLSGEKCGPVVGRSAR